MLMVGNFRGNLHGTAWMMPGFAAGDVALDGHLPGWSLRADASDVGLWEFKLSPGSSADGDIPASTATTTNISIGGSIRSTIDTAGDHDWIRVELVAGQTYQFALNGVDAGALSDPSLNLRDSVGNVIASDDDGGAGYNSLLTFTAASTGTYYLDAHAYSNETGTYELTAAQAATPEPTSVLDTIDWGTQVQGSALTVYFATTGQSFDGETAGANWSAAEKAAVMAAFGVYADVANITFTEAASSASATFVLVKAELEPDVLGYCNPPGETNAGVGVFNHTNSTWTDQGLQPGGYAFVTLIHELGHGLGLAHPHDDGGTSTVMTGVTGPSGSYGTSGLNQGVFTTMSYNDGWATGPNGVNVNANNYGWQGTLSPLDIAVIQQKYGANTNHNNDGISWYQLVDANAAGTMYQAIWDTGGVDYIYYSGSRDAVIDLRAATLLDAAGGGGYVSYVNGIIGGFTIANGVVVEKAFGGSGNDTLTGNSAANTMGGREGNDTIDAGGGDDRVYAGSGDDTVYGGDGRDGLYGMEGDDFISGGNGNDRIDGGDGNDRLYGDAGRDVIFGGAGDDLLRGGGGNDFFHGGAGNDRIDGNSGSYDRAFYSGNFADYQLQYDSAADQVRVTDLRDGQPEGYDRLVNVEFLQFTDGYVVVNGGNFNFQPSAEPVGSESTSKSGAGDGDWAALATDSVVNYDGVAVKTGILTVMDALTSDHDGFVSLTIGDAATQPVPSWAQQEAAGWAVFHDDGAQTPDAESGWALLSDPAFEAHDGAEMVARSPIIPNEIPTDWAQSGGFDDIPIIDHEPAYDAGGVSGWM